MIRTHGDAVASDVSKKHVFRKDYFLQGEYSYK